MDDADVDDLEAGREQLALERGVDARRRQAAVAAERDAARAVVGEVRAQRAAELGDERVGEIVLRVTA